MLLVVVLGWDGAPGGSRERELTAARVSLVVQRVMQIVKEIHASTLCVSRRTRQGAPGQVQPLRAVPAIPRSRIQPPAPSHPRAGERCRTAAPPPASFRISRRGPRHNPPPTLCALTHRQACCDSAISDPAPLSPRSVGCKHPSVVHWFHQGASAADSDRRSLALACTSMGANVSASLVIRDSHTETVDPPAVASLPRL